jgi:hypothetical protein
MLDTFGGTLVRTSTSIRHGIARVLVLLVAVRASDRAGTRDALDLVAVATTLAAHDVRLAA